MAAELVLALMDSDLDALDGGGRDVGISHAHVQLLPGQTREGQAHGVGIQNWIYRDLQSQNLIGIYPTTQRNRILMPFELTSAFSTQSQAERSKCDAAGENIITCEVKHHMLATSNNVLLHVTAVISYDILSLGNTEEFKFIKVLLSL